MWGTRAAVYVKVPTGCQRYLVAVAGFGNNGEDKTEGLLYKNTFCTYAHGPVLPKNPALADEILKRALKTDLQPIDDKFENLCHDSLVKKFG